VSSAWATGRRNWDLRAVEAEAHEPRILSSGDDARAILLILPAGEQLQEHEVHEYARIVVIDGEAEIETADGERVAAGTGHMFEFAPGERRTVAARSDARLLILLTPWPGDGHPGAMTLEEKAGVRERAAERSPSA
jgi:quercetin dioxygenase-like cupin family protein